MSIKRIIKNINMTKEDRKLVIQILVIILIMILIIITSFNAGRKFYYLKNTFSENKKVECKGKIASWNFDVKVGSHDNKNPTEEKNEEMYNEYENNLENIEIRKSTYTINAYKLTLNVNNIPKIEYEEKNNIQKLENTQIKEEPENEDRNSIEKEPEQRYNIEKRSQDKPVQEDKKDTFVIIKK